MRLVDPRSAWYTNTDSTRIVPDSTSPWSIATGTHHKSIIKQAIERLDSKMAIGESRYEAKRQARAEAEKTGTPFWSFSTGKIHSHKTRMTYQEHALRFVHWARETEGIRDLEHLDLRANELASRYLRMGMEAGKSPYTLQTERASLRMFFADRDLANDVALPKRLIKNITRSRGAAARDRHFQPANWPEFMTFQTATGLRKSELQRITVGDIYSDPEGCLVALVRNGKGGKKREVPVLAGHEQKILDLVAGRKPEEPVLEKVPDTDVHGMRRLYAQALYQQYAPGWPALPPKEQRLQPTDYHQAAALKVSQALGHRRLDVVLNNYLR